jgi:lipopolysaccharide export system permease protein
LNKVNVDDKSVSNTNTMLNVSELNYTLDSLHKNLDTEIVSFSENINQRIGMQRSINTTLPIPKTKKLPDNLLSKYANAKKLRILNYASSNIENNLLSITATKTELEFKQKNINGHILAFYDKFVIAYACFLMFFIGAPLGAIIRKGGLGLPIVFAVLIFISFHFINTFGKRISQENGLSPILGAWMSSILLTPLAILLTYRATNDIGDVNFDFFTNLFKRIIPIDESIKDNVQPIINIDSYSVVKDDEWIKLNEHSDETLINIVKNAKQFNFSYDYRTRALIVLNSRGISQENLIANNNLYNLDYDNMQAYSIMYHKFSKIAFAADIIGIIILNAKNNVSAVLIIACLLNISVFYYSLYKAQEKLDKIGKIVGRKIEPGIMISIIIGFPFYLFIYFYNNKVLKESLEQYR